MKSFSVSKSLVGLALMAGAALGACSSVGDGVSSKESNVEMADPASAIIDVILTGKFPWTCAEHAPKATQATETKDVPADTWPGSGVVKVTYTIYTTPTLEYRKTTEKFKCKDDLEARVTGWVTAMSVTAFNDKGEIVLSTPHGIPLKDGKAQTPLSIHGKTDVVYKGESPERDTWLLATATSLVGVVTKVSGGQAAPQEAPEEEEEEGSAGSASTTPSTDSGTTDGSAGSASTTPSTDSGTTDGSAGSASTTPSTDSGTTDGSAGSASTTTSTDSGSTSTDLGSGDSLGSGFSVTSSESTSTSGSTSGSASPVDAGVDASEAGSGSGTEYVNVNNAAPPKCEAELKDMELATVNYVLLWLGGKASEAEAVWLLAYALRYQTCMDGPDWLYKALNLILPKVEVNLPRPAIAGGNPIVPFKQPPAKPAPNPMPAPAPAPAPAPMPKVVNPLKVPDKPMDTAIMRALQNFLVTGPDYNDAVKKMKLCNATGGINRSVDILFTVQCSNFFFPPPAGFEEVITINPTLNPAGQMGDCVNLLDEISPRFAMPPNANCIVTRIAMQTPLAFNQYTIMRNGDTFTLDRAGNP